MSFDYVITTENDVRTVRDWLLEGRPSEEEAIRVLRDCHTAAKHLRVILAYLTGYVMELRQLDPDVEETPRDLTEFWREDVIE